MIKTQENPISLRRFKENDLERLASIINHPLILNYLEIDTFTLDKEREWLNVVLLSYKMKLPTRHNRAVDLHGELIGSVGIHSINYEAQSAEIGYWLGVDYHGKGYTTEAISKLIKIIYREFPLKKLFANVSEFNYASKRVIEKNGFVLDISINPNKTNPKSNHLKYVLLLKHSN